MNSHDDSRPSLGTVIEILKRVEIAQTRQGEQVTRIDARMKKVEISMAKHSLIGGGLAAIGIGVCIEYLKHKFISGA